MKYRVVQYIERQCEYSDGLKLTTAISYKYIAQRRYDWWPFWSDICLEKNFKEEAQAFIDADIKERKMPRVIIHNIDPQ